MSKATQAISNDMGQLAEDARALMAATADVAGEKVGEARKRLAAALESAKEIAGNVRDRTVEGANGRKMGGTFYGRKESSNKAKPFWGWHDNATRKKNLVNTGQWALDPAYSLTRSVTYPAGLEPSLDYTFNPYLGVE